MASLDHEPCEICSYLVPDMYCWECDGCEYCCMCYEGESDLLEIQ